MFDNIENYYKKCQVSCSKVTIDNQDWISCIPNHSFSEDEQLNCIDTQSKNNDKYNYVSDDVNKYFIVTQHAQHEIKHTQPIIIV